MTKAKKHWVYQKNCRYIYPWFSMEVGDWFLVPCRHSCAAAATWIHSHYVGLRFSLRKQKDGSVRCYRVEQ